jgi:hypothetical protein
MCATTFQVAKNNAGTTLNGAIDDNDLTILLTDSSVFPTTYPYPVSIGNEILYVSNNNTGTNTITVTRGDESTVAAAHDTLSVVALLITAKYITDLNTAVNALEALKLDTIPAPTDSTTRDVSTSAHGLIPKAVAPAAGLQNVYGIANGETAVTNKALFDATNPSTQAIADSAAVGTAMTAARRDHKHAMPAASDLFDDTAGGTDALLTKAPTSNAFRDHAVATTDVHGAGAGTLATTATAQQYVEDTGLVMADAKNIEFDPSPGTSHTANGIIVTLTAGAALVFGDACYMGTDGKMEKALADDAAITIPATHLCLATISENSAGLFLEKGWAHDDHFAFDVGKSIYLSAATAGLITKTMPTKVTGNQVQVLGLCGEIADVIYWNPDSTIVEYA